MKGRNDMTTDNPYADKEKDYETAIAMDKIAKGIFAPVYPLLAEQIVEAHGITRGICVEIGAGPGPLAIALAKITDLEIYALDQSEHAVGFAKDNAAEQGVADQINFIREDVVSMPFEDDYADLIVSRGSLFFWQDLTAAFNEIFRILKPGGKTHIGGGFGNKEVKNKIFEAMAKKDGNFAKKVGGRMGPENLARFKAALGDSLVDKYEISQTDAGLWIYISKS